MCADFPRVTPHRARSLPARNREREDECGDKVEREVRGIHGSCERWVGVVGMYPLALVIEVEVHVATGRKQNSSKHTSLPKLLGKHS